MLEIASLDGRHRKYDQHVRGAELVVNDSAITDVCTEAKIPLNQLRQRPQGILGIDGFFRRAIHLDIALAQSPSTPWFRRCRIMMQERKRQSEAIGVGPVKARASEHHVAAVLQEVSMDAVPQEFDRPFVAVRGKHAAAAQLEKLEMAVARDQ